MFLSISHNLKTPLNSIKLLAEKIEKEIPLEKNKKDLIVIKHN